MSLGREALNWDEQIWAAIDLAVHEENVRAGVAAKVIPLSGPQPEAVTVPAEAIDPATMTVDESAVVPLVELTVDFSLTRQQVEQEAVQGTAAALARRAAALLTQAEDVVVLQGDAALNAGLLGGAVKGRGPAGVGLVDAAAEAVKANGGGTFGAVASGVLEAPGQLAHGPLRARARRRRVRGGVRGAQGRARVHPRSGCAGWSRRFTEPRRCPTGRACSCRSGGTPSTWSSAATRTSPSSGSTPTTASASGSWSGSCCGSKTRRLRAARARRRALMASRPRLSRAYRPARARGPGCRTAAVGRGRRALRGGRAGGRWRGECHP